MSAPLMRWMAGCLFVIGVGVGGGYSVRAAVIGAGSYAIESQMVMPHLDEMRRISEHQTECVAQDDAAQFFPVFKQPALIGCRLRDEPSSDFELNYVLTCDSVNGASGSAQLRLDGEHIKGILKAKMGGKNMTFSQHIQATREGDCATP
jgi:hypothetical protein